jgi:hypothetical protein
MAMTAPDGAAQLAGAVVRRLGGRFSAELGIDVDAGDAEIDRWFLAATLFGTRISTAVAERAFRVLDGNGITCVAQASERTWDELVGLLDAAGYVRYDFRTATRLQDLAAALRDRWDGTAAEIGCRLTDPDDLAGALDDLPGWGPVTVGLFLRELRGVWPGARLPFDRRAAGAARHLGLLDATDDALEQLGAIARRAGVDARDLEAALVRLALRHRRRADCPGRRACIAMGGIDSIAERGTNGPTGLTAAPGSLEDADTEVTDDQSREA